jgi:hypothetical protein
MTVRMNLIFSQLDRMTRKSGLQNIFSGQKLCIGSDLSHTRCLSSLSNSFVGYLTTLYQKLFSEIGGRAEGLKKEIIRKDGESYTKTVSYISSQLTEEIHFLVHIRPPLICILSHINIIQLCRILTNYKNYIACDMLIVEARAFKGK